MLFAFTCVGATALHADVRQRRYPPLTMSINHPLTASRRFPE
jgi:hypothetical protein